jgi:hypothetical protein
MLPHISTIRCNFINRNSCKENLRLILENQLKCHTLHNNVFLTTITEYVHQNVLSQLIKRQVSENGHKYFHHRVTLLYGNYTLGKYLTPIELFASKSTPSNHKRDGVLFSIRLFQDVTSAPHADIRPSGSVRPSFPSPDKSFRHA